MKAVLCLLFLCWIGYAESGHYFVTAPNVLRFNHDETLLFSVFDEQNFDIEIFLSLTEDGEPFFVDSKRVPNEQTPVTITVRATEKDLFPDEKARKDPPKFIFLSAKTKFGLKKTKILVSYDTGYIVLQTSKPVYHPTDKVWVRALAMTENLQFARGWNISMDVISPSDLTFGRVTKTEHDDKFFQDSFILPPHAEEGLWTIKAFYRGQFKTEARTTFKVMKYVLPTFGVKLNVEEKIILEDMEEINIFVESNYVYEKPVKGRVRLTIACQKEDGTRTEYPEIISEKLVEGKKVITFPIQQLYDLTGGFPEGQILHIKAQVLEYVTGNEEATVYTGSLFSRRVYQIDFKNSKKYYRPGHKYYLRVSISFANGQSPGITRFSARELSNKLQNDEDFDSTQKSGEGLIIFSTTSRSQETLRFQVDVNGEKSEVFTVEAYQGEDQMVIEQIMKGNDMIVEATVTVKGEATTGIMALVMSRGQYMDHILFDPSVNPQETIDKALQERITPEARLVAFYVNKGSNKLVADSSKFSLTPKCRGNGLELEADKPEQLKPNSQGILKIRGSPRMTVGLNAMDKALLLIDDEHVLRKSKMFDVMKSHDLGCGRGGGINAEQVLKDAGVTVLTNAVINTNKLERSKMSCEGHSRKKRALDCSYTNIPDCCKMGMKYANKLLFEDMLNKYEEDYEPKDPYTACYKRTKEMSEEAGKGGIFKYPYLCLVDHFIKCVEVMNEGRDVNLVEGKSVFDDTDDYIAALQDYGIDEDVFVRKDFKDSWLFDIKQLDGNGYAEVPIIMPHSITTWMFQGIGIMEDHGFCIAESENVTSTLPFFIQLEVPYSAKRLEYFEITATVFNHRDQDAKVTLFIEGVKGLCTGAEAGKMKKVTEQFDLNKNDAYSVRIPVLALEAGRYEIKVTAIGKMGPITGLSDSVLKELIVENEGVMKRETITVCLNPLKEETETDCTSSDRIVQTQVFDGVQRITVDLTLPDGVYKDTGSAYGYLSSNVMEDVVITLVSGLDHLVNQPVGCGEQTMIYLAPMVYVMDYWKQKNKMTKQREVRGNQWIRDGVKRELTFRKLDGSYGAWLGRGSSTWLTAFVAKVFCQAKRVVDDSVKKVEHITKSIDWLKGKTNANGAFYDPLPVIHREMIGQIKERDPSLTAFVLITLLECDRRTPELDQIINKAVKYLTSLPDQLYLDNTYLLAITTYALALNNNNLRWRYKNMLMRKKQENRAKNYLYWGNSHAANRHYVETSSYALLALLKFNDISNAGKIVRWLTNQRDAIGSWRSTQVSAPEPMSLSSIKELVDIKSFIQKANELRALLLTDIYVKYFFWAGDLNNITTAYTSCSYNIKDTVIALQALSEYSIATKSPNANLEVKLSADRWKGATQKLTNENNELLGLIKNIPAGPGQNLLTVTTVGEGSGRLVIDLRYNRPQNDYEQCSFKVGEIIIGEVKGVDVNIPENFNRDCDVCGICKNEGGVIGPVNIGFGELPIPEAIKPKAGIQKRSAKQNGNQPVPKKRHCITFDLSSDREHGMSIVDFGLETGMTVLTEDLEQLKFDGVIDSYEIPESGKGFVILYLNEITSETKTFKFRLEDNFQGDPKTRQPAAIKIYDYYSPEIECTKFYGTGERGGNPVNFQCEKKDGLTKGTCSCLAEMCPEAGYEEKIMKEARERKKPAQQLSFMTCDRNKAELALVMRVDAIKADFTTKTFTATVTVISQVHEGTNKLVKNQPIELFWKMNCQDIKLIKDQRYYLITKEEGLTSRIQIRGRDSWKYQLSGKTVIVKESDWARKLSHAQRRALTREKKKEAFLQQIMSKYEELMKKGCLE